MRRYKTYKCTLFFIFALLFLLSTSVFTLMQVSATQTAEIEADTKESDDIKVLNDREIIVFSYEALANALQEDNGYTTFYIGDNIMATSNVSIVIHESKSEVIIDGYPPATPKGAHHSFTPYESNTTNAIFHVAPNNTTLQNFTIQNFDIHGANSDSIIFIPDSVPNVHVLFHNMNYTGLKAITNHSGTARFVDCVIEMSPAVDLELKTLAEANHIEIGGTTTITTITSSSTASLLWLTNNNTTFCILEDANVEIQVPGYFFHANSGTPTVHIQQNATFNLLKIKGFTQPGENVKNFLVEKNANVTLTQTTPSTLAALQVEETLEVQTGATLSIMHMGPGIALYFPHSGGRAIFNEPNRVFLFNHRGPLISFEGSGELKIQTTSMNIWYGESLNFNQPSHYWNDKNNALLSITVSYSNSTTFDIEHSLSEDAPIHVPLDKQHFDLPNATLMTFGDAYLNVSPIYTRSDKIYGYADPGAIITINYTDMRNQEVNFSDTSDSNGYFSFNLNMGPLENAPITIESAVRTVKVRHKEYPIALPDEPMLAFSSVPSNIFFTNVPIPSSPTTVLRDDADFSLSIRDTRADRTPWKINVSLSNPLTAILPSKTHVLPNALVFVDKTGMKIPLTTEPSTVYESEHSHYGEFIIQWDETQGILLNVNPSELYSNVAYTTTIQWCLVDAP